MSKLKVEYRNIADLNPYENNSNSICHYRMAEATSGTMMSKEFSDWRRDDDHQKHNGQRGF